ncbi:MAG TPA: aminotransferase class V-fold PLP-dependent enzyme [Steroidobacteraceae bacterium]|jgi:cysteine desulfurase|nr:aminotransferase class V-fold PLP-dependent enzyme [Steroidobacteraceae bacterium]
MDSEFPVYLDYAATTPCDPRVAAAMQACLTIDGVFGNPASGHAYGRVARARVEQARAQVAALIHAPAPQLVWTSGSTEANNLAILGTARALRSRGRHLITVRTEHKSVLDPCRHLQQEGFEVTYLAPDRDGLIATEQVREALRPDTLLVSVMHANNEIGVLQPIETIGDLCRAKGVALHVDASQSAGKVRIDVAQLRCDLLSLTAHKLYGPKGIGALYFAAERRASLQPLTFGGGHERGLRSGTLPVHQIVGFGAACELAAASLADDAAHSQRLRDLLWAGLRRIPDVLLNGHPTQRIGNILNVSFPGVEGESLLMGLTELAISTGSACNSDSDEPSYVLRALGRDTELAQSSLRFSVGRFSSEADVAVAVAAVSREVQRLRAAAA